ncbi:hypothetical protein GJ496_008592 [Pomphorhynchus laevis]|nr:hypothetical protein GJ496_008592 [Pomphorhynchus laevis]
MGSLLSRNGSLVKFEYLFSLICLGETTELNEVFSKCEPKEIESILNIRDSEKMNGMNLVMYAAHYGQPDVLEVLLSHNPDLSKTDTDGRNALHHSIISQNSKVVEMLVDKVDVNKTDIIKSTPIHEAAKLGSSGILSILLEHGAKANVSDVDGVTPLHLAVDLCDFETVKLLVGRKCNPNAKDKWGWTPMHIAAAHNTLDILQFLISKGGQINISDKCGNTPLRWAKEAKSDRTINFLKKSGAKINDDRFRRQFLLHDLDSVKRT